MESYEVVARRRIVNAINGRPTDHPVFDQYISEFSAALHNRFHDCIICMEDCDDTICTKCKPIILTLAKALQDTAVGCRELSPVDESGNAIDTRLYGARSTVRCAE